MSTATYAQLTAEIASNWPSGNPTTLTAASARRYLQDQIDSLNVAASTTSTVNLSTYQPFVNTASVAAAAVLLQVYDGTQGVTWGQLNSTAHTIALISNASIAATLGISSGSAVSATGSIAATAGISSGSGMSAVGVITAQNATATASTASQVLQMGTTSLLGLYWGNASPPTVSTAASGSLYISTTGTSSSTRMYVSNSVQTWIAVTTAS